MSHRDIVLVRHAQASFGADEYDRLSALGEAQSRRLGHWLAESGLAAGQIAIGPRQRHRHTAELTLQAANLHRPLRRLDGLDEIDHVELLARERPDLAGPDALRAELRQHDHPQRAFQRLFEAAIARWTSGEKERDYTITWPQFRDNIQRAIAQLAEWDDGPVWAFTSGGPIGVLSSLAVGVPLERAFAMSWPLLNTSLTRLRPGKRGLTLVGYNAWPHLEAEPHHSLRTLR